MICLNKDMLLNHKQIKNQRGVTLLLALLVMAALTAIVFSAAAIIYNEVKTSGDLTKTEPIITADEAVAEDSLFKLARGFSTLASCLSPSSSTVGSVTVTTCGDYYEVNPYLLNLAINARRDFYLYNPANQSASPGYTSVSIQMNSGFQGTVYLCNWTDTDCPTSASPIDVKTIASAGPTTTWNSPVLNPSNLYILTVVNSAVNSGTYTVTSAPIGLPAGTTTIQEVGTQNGLTRKLRVSVPQ